MQNKILFNVAGDKKFPEMNKKNRMVCCTWLAGRQMVSIFWIAIQMFRSLSVQSSVGYNDCAF